MNAPIKILSYGGGLDSFAMLLDAIARDEKPALAVFADVGDPEGKDPGEWPGTYKHIREIVMPLCAAHGIEFVWIDTRQLPIRGERSLFAYFENMKLMPGRMSRLCTSAAKVERIADYLNARFPGVRLEVWIGFEAGEEKRAERDPHAAGRAKGLRTNRFPLAERGLCRCRCEALVRASGHPVPRKSACVYCPFGTRGDFQTFARELPEHFARTEALEANCRSTKSGRRVLFSGSATNARTLRDWAERPYTPRAMGCSVCGATTRATKATACGYLDDAPGAA